MLSQYFVYKLLNKEEIVYVGQTTGLDNRINQHKADKVFDSVLVIEVDCR